MVVPNSATLFLMEYHVHVHVHVVAKCLCDSYCLLVWQLLPHLVCFVGLHAVQGSNIGWFLRTIHRSNVVVTRHRLPTAA